MNFDVTDAETRVIGDIAKRACSLYPELDHMTMMMDLTLVHAGQTPLRLVDFLSAPEPDFRHDIAGIYNNLDRRTGMLKNLFSPRYSA